MASRRRPRQWPIASLHDAKSAAIIARLHADGLSARLPEEVPERRQLKAALAIVDLHQERYLQLVNRLESWLARHWPELPPDLSPAQSSSRTTDPFHRIVLTAERISCAHRPPISPSSFCLNCLRALQRLVRRHHRRVAVIPFAAFSVACAPQSATPIADRPRRHQVRPMLRQPREGVRRIAAGEHQEGDLATASPCIRLRGSTGRCRQPLRAEAA